jgi:hypothetical protein
MSEFDYTQEERQRDINEGLYIPFYIDDVIDDLEVTIGDETSEVITVTCALVDPAGTNIPRKTLIRLVLFTDDDYDDVIDNVLTGITIAATTGKLLPSELHFNSETGIDMLFVTDANGDLVITFTDAGAGSQTAALGFILPNGQFVEGGTILFAS